MARTLFFDVDTQHDFIMPDGKLYVPGAEKTIPQLTQLTLYARHHGIRMAGDVDWHTPSAPEISENPDFLATFPPHCIQNSPGAKKIPGTEPERPLWIDSEPILWKELERRIRTHSGEIYFRKNQLDVFGNPNVNPVLDILDPDVMVVYGVALDFCVALAMEGLLKRGNVSIYLVRDASQPINEDRARKMLKDWEARGVKVVQTADVLSALSQATV